MVPGSSGSCAGSSNGEECATDRIGSLDKQLPVANPRDELGQLATTFNELLSRLNSAFAEQRRFMADASHDYARHSQ